MAGDALALEDRLAPRPIAPPRQGRSIASEDLFAGAGDLGTEQSARAGTNVTILVIQEQRSLGRPDLSSQQRILLGGFQRQEVPGFAAQDSGENLRADRR